MGNSKSGRMPAHKALIEGLDYFIGCGGIGEPHKHGQLERSKGEDCEVREVNHLDVLEPWVRYVILPNGKGEARGIAEQIIGRLGELHEMALSEVSKSLISGMIQSLQADYLKSDSDADGHSDSHVGEDHLGPGECSPGMGQAAAAMIEDELERQG